MVLVQLLLAAFVTVFASVVSAETHTFNWTTGWDYYNVDGTYERPVMTCNGEFPWPSIRVKQGDRLQIYLTNGFDDRNTSLHFHGMFQNGTNQMDGPPMVTQCPIAPGDTFLYNFTVDYNLGTYWYHSHTDGQYEDGMRGAFIIEPADDEYPFDFDEDVVLQIGEWYHDTVDVLDESFMSLYNPTGAEPIPKNLIINNTRNLTWNVEPSTTYLLRIVNTGGFVSQYFWIEDHEMTVVEVDGVYVEQNTTDMLYITVAQRYSVLVTTKNSTDTNYAIMQKFDDDMLDVLPDDLVYNATSYMIYNDSAATPSESYVDSLDNYLDDFYLVPLDREELLPDYDYEITVDVVMDNLDDGINYAFFNNITYTAPKVPTLLTSLSSGNYVMTSTIYGSNTNAFVLQKDEIVQIVVNNNDTGTHPFHLHGHVFQLIERDQAWEEDDGYGPHPYDEDDHDDFPLYPVKRDTAYVRSQSSMVLRFKADNPGVWFFHCHIEWHLKQGLAMLMVEAPDYVQDTDSQQLTDNHISVCESVGVPTTGNAAGNSEDFLDLTGENIQAGTIPGHFTKKGIIAMTFSCLAGILGMVCLAVYGLLDVKEPETEFIKDMGLDLKVVAEEPVQSEEFNKDYSNEIDGSGLEHRRS